MSSIVCAQHKTSSMLREKLFETMDRLIKGDIDLDYVEGICAVSEQVLDVAKLDFEVAKKAHEIETAGVIDTEATLKRVELILDTTENGM